MSHLLHCSCTMVYRDLPWYTMVYDGMPTMVYHGHTMVYHTMLTVWYSWGVNSAKIHNYPLTLAVYKLNMSHIRWCFGVKPTSFQPKDARHCVYFLLTDRCRAESLVVTCALLSFCRNTSSSLPFTYHDDDDSAISNTAQPGTHLAACHSADVFYANDVITSPPCRRFSAASSFQRGKSSFFSFLFFLSMIICRVGDTQRLSLP